MARYGGEEFTVILPNTRFDELHAIAARIIRNVKYLNFPTSGVGL
ncbi:diguanylate cyclase domain-containing protein [Alteromonas macleodii]